MEVLENSPGDGGWHLREPSPWARGWSLQEPPPGVGRRSQRRETRPRRRRAEGSSGIPGGGEVPPGRELHPLGGGGESGPGIAPGGGGGGGGAGPRHLDTGQWASSHDDVELWH